MASFLYKAEIVKKLFLTLVALFVLIALRLFFDQWQGYSKGVEYLEKADYKNAIMHFDRTLNAHIPFSPLEKKAKNHLLELASGFEKKGEYELALVCYETIRTSRYLARHIWIPDKNDIRLLNDKIASIKAVLLEKDGMVGNFKEGYNQQLDIMNKDFSPSTIWSLIAVSALFSYIGLVILWIIKRDRGSALAFVIVFFIWIIALYKA